MRNFLLSPDSSAFLLLYDNLAAGTAYGKGTGDHLNDARVFASHELAARVKKESHRMKGLVRFREVEGAGTMRRWNPITTLSSLSHPASPADLPSKNGLSMTSRAA